MDASSSAPRPDEAPEPGEESTHAAWGAGRQLIWRAIGSCRRDVRAACLLLTGHQIGESLVPVITGAVVGRAIVPGGGWRIFGWLGVLAADFLFLSLCYRFGARANRRSQQRTAHAVRMWLTGRVVRRDGGVAQAPGELLSRASSDATRVGAFAGLLASMLAALVVLILATVLLLRFSPILAAVILAGTALLLLVQDRVSRLLRGRSGAEQQRLADATSLAEDLVRGLRVLKGIGAERAAAAGYARASRSALRGSLRSVSAEATLQGASALITGSYLAVIVGVGGWLALSGRLGLAPLISALGLAQFVLGPMQTIAAASAGYARAVASADRVVEILRLPPAVPDRAHGSVSGPLDIVFDAVPTSAAPGSAARMISFRAPADALTGLVIDDPLVAAELVSLLARERDPVAGRAALGGLELSGWALARLRATLLVAPHDAAVFDATLADNLTLGASDPGSVRRAQWAATVDQVIETVPGGAQAAVGERGQHLSGGQRQRLALARALAADAPVLVLHDPTTSVDAATEDLIAARLAELRAGRTTVLITTSPALLARCDHVVVLDTAGTRTGTHRQLIARDTGYRDRVTR